MLKRVNHIGIAVKDLDQAMKFWHGTFGVDTPPPVDEKDMKICMMRLGDVLVEPHRADRHRGGNGKAYREARRGATPYMLRSGEHLQGCRGGSRPRAYLSSTGSRGRGLRARSSFSTRRRQTVCSRRSSRSGKDLFRRARSFTSTEVQGMDFQLTEEQTMFRDMARKFSKQEIIPYLKEYERQERFFEAVIGKARDVGLVGPHIPEKYGGLGLDRLTVAIIMEETLLGKLQRGPQFFGRARPAGEHHPGRRQRRAENAMAASDVPGGEVPGRCGGRAFCGKRRLEHRNNGSKERKQMGAERHQALHHRWRKG